MADDYEFRMAGTNRLPGFGVFRGREEYISEQTRLLEHLDVDHVELDDLIPLGDGRVAMLMRFVVRAGETTIDQLALDFHEFRDGELIRQTLWFDRDEGLRELGLST